MENKQNEFVARLDFPVLQRLFVERGKLRCLKKKDYFLRQGELSAYVGYVKSGVLRSTCLGSDGNEPVVAYAFTNEFVGCYASFIHSQPAFINIQAVTDCEIYTLSYAEVAGFWERDMGTQRMGRQLAEELFRVAYLRLLVFYCDTPEQAYKKLIERCPDLPNKIPLREIASFLKVTPETVSRIRKRLLKKGET